MSSRSKRRLPFVTRRTCRIVLVDDVGHELTSWRLEIPWPPDVATVDLLSRWQLTAKRNRNGMFVVEAPGELLDLIELCGLRSTVTGL